MTHTLRTLLVLAFVTLSLVGCHRRARTTEVAVAPAASAGGARGGLSHRHYRNLLRTAARDMQCRHDQLVPQEISPGIFSLQGCGLIRDYVMVCRGRHRCRWEGIVPVEQVAITETRCATGTVQLAVTGPVTRQIVACGQTLDYALACGPTGCGWTRGAAASGMVMETEPGTSMLVIADDGSAPPPAAAPAPAGEESDEVQQMGAAGTIQAVFATQIAAIRACASGQPVTVQVRWDAQGVVTLTLAPPFGGTAVEACVQQSIGPVVIQGVTAPGEIHAQM
jgi:hypothetical protein